MCYEVSYLGDGSDILGLWGRIFILDFAYISRKFPFDPRLFPLKLKKYLHCHPCVVDWNIHFL